MNAPETSLPIRLLVSVFALLISTIVLISGVRHGVADRLAQREGVDSWRRAAAWESDNPENWHRLGRYYQTDFEHPDLQQAILNYQRATFLSPGTAEYWL